MRRLTMRARSPVHVRAWQVAYSDILPAGFLSGLSVAERAERRMQTLSDPEIGTWVADQAGIQGFVAVGASRDADGDGGVGEVYAIYVAPELWFSGIGSALLRRGVLDLRERSFTASTLWVLGDNSLARRFYEARGWKSDQVFKVDTLDGVELHEVRYRLNPIH